MIRSRLRQLIAAKADKEDRRITYRAIEEATSVKASTVSRLANNKVERFDARTISLLCAYFDCQVGDLLQYAPDPEGAGRSTPAKARGQRRPARRAANSRRRDA